MSHPEISVVLPMFNEAAVLHEVLRTIALQLDAVSESWEIICVNDGSSDETAARLDELADADTRIVPLHLSRNFGKEAAMAAGIDSTNGQATFFLDADLQHPPTLFPEMVNAWRHGADVVSGVKRSRGDEGEVYGAMARLFYVLMGSSAGSELRGASDFKLLDRQVIEALRLCPERHRFFRGLVAWVGFRTVEIPFDVQERIGGDSKWSTSALIRYSLKNLLAFSAFPLRAIAMLGFSTLTFTVLMGGWTLYRWFRGDSVAGFPTVILLQLIFGSLLLTSLGVVSVYLAEMYDEMKRRPLYIFRAPTPRDKAAPSASRAS